MFTCLISYVTLSLYIVSTSNPTKIKRTKYFCVFFCVGVNLVFLFFFTLDDLRIFEVSFESKKSVFRMLLVYDLNMNNHHMFYRYFVVA